MRIKKIITTAAMAALPLIAAAIPATPDLIRHTNPDGTVVECRVFGDESFSYITDAKGENLLEIDNKGRLVPMMRDGLALRADESEIVRLQSERMVDLNAMMPARNIQRMAALETSGTNKGRTTFPSIGDVRSLVILLEFPDRPFSAAQPKEGEKLDEKANDEATKKLFERMLNEEGFSDFRALGSAADYYRSVSNGKFKPQFDVYGPVKLQHPADWYCQIADDDPIWKRDENGKSQLSAYEQAVLKGNQPRYAFALVEALEALDDEIDFSLYDYDKDKIIDNIFFFYSGWGKADTLDPSSVWPHQGNFQQYTDTRYLMGNLFKLPKQVRDGVEFVVYATSCELNSSSRIAADQKPWLNGIGTFCHEFAHVLGVPDLYDAKAQSGGTASKTKTPGDYTVMDSGAYNTLSTCPPMFSAYEQWMCKWLEYTDAADGETYQLSPLTDDDRNAVRLRIRKPGGTVSYYSEYYLVETRAKKGWDESLPKHGMFIWRINYSNSTWADNSVNSYGITNVELIGPDPMDNKSVAWPDEDNDIFSLYPGMNVLTPTCLSGTPLNVNITGMEYDKETGKASFEYNKYSPTDQVTVMHENPTANPQVRHVYLEWDEVPGMQYMLTVKRQNANGSESVVDGLDARIVDENRHTVRNISKSQWSLTFTAYVRLFNGVPGTGCSNVITFIPEELTVDTAVEGVSAEVPVIYGGKGCVVAPEGSKVYNLNGVECGMENLPAGIYIVVTKGATAKVTVR